MDLETKYFTCACFSPEHIFRVVFDPTDEILKSEIFIQIRLCCYDNIIKRIITAFKYILGYKSKYGEFDEIILDKKETTELRDFLNKYLENIK